jgi:hypothetical protein
MVIEITITTVLMLTAFIVGVFLLYKLLKFFMRASLVVAASFAFPWVASYMGIGITADLSSGMMFAASGFGLFCVYELFHFIVQFFKMITWPLRRKGGK